MAVELLLVRHGESVRNLACDHAREGRHDWLARQMAEETEESAWPLTETGVEQARRTGDWIREHAGGAFDRGVCSPFVRARDTAHHLGLGIEWLEDERVREREWGDYCAAGLEPYTVDAYLQHLAECADFVWRAPFPGAESLADLVPRSRAAIGELLSGLGDGRAIVVAHGGSIRAMQMVLEGLADGQHDRLPPVRLSNGCVLQYQFSGPDLSQGGQWRLAQPNIPGAPVEPWRPVGTLSP